MTALESMAALLLLWVFVCIFWKEYCLDVFRHNLFALRDELFIYAGRGNIGFQHPAYRMLRDRMNSSIRYGHELTLSRLLLAMVMVPHKEESEVWEGITASLTLEQKSVLTQYRNAFAFYAVNYVVLRSFFLAILVLCVRVISSLREGLKRLFTAKVVAAVERLEIETIEVEVRRHEQHDHNRVTVGV